MGRYLYFTIKLVIKTKIGMISSIPAPAIALGAIKEIAKNGKYKKNAAPNLAFSGISNCLKSTNAYIPKKHIAASIILAYRVPGTTKRLVM